MSYKVGILIDQMFFAITEDAAKKLGMYDFMMNNALAGALTVIILVLVIRFFFKALLYSWLGRRGGSMISIMFEAVVVLMFVSSAWRNPGVVVAGIAWGAVIFKTVLQSI